MTLDFIGKSSESAKNSQTRSTISHGNANARTLRDEPLDLTDVIEDHEKELNRRELYSLEFRNFANSSKDQKSNVWINRRQTTKTSDGIKASAEPDGGNPNMINNPPSTIGKKEDTNKKKEGMMTEKMFLRRESYLTALSKVTHIKTIYHISYVIFFVYLLNNIINDYCMRGSVRFGLDTIKLGFRDIHYAFGVWILQKAFVCSLYYNIRIWWNIRAIFLENGSLQRLWSLSCLLAYITSQVTFIYIPSKICQTWNLPFATTAALLLETCRMLMKMHAYTRTICARLSHRDTKGKLDQSMPTFGKYLYYLFAPTFLYRDSYPRTSHIRWKFAVARFTECVCITFLFSFIHENQLRPYLANSGKEELLASFYMQRFFDILAPCMLILLGTFYLILHAWLNFTAELLRFGDRMFCRDWWTARNYDSYFRDWNVVVGDWFYELIYKDLYLHVFKGSKNACLLVVYLLSALMHEFFLIYGLKMFFPVLFVLFCGFGVACIFITRRLSASWGNLFFWTTLTFGNGIMFFLYYLEYYTSQNCPKESYKSWSDFLIPHLWSCYAK
ncbi:sterol O-acyltransferase 1 [Stomoxys calcitrans]|uniref:O-acyltransferase n=1 Tax=Stomoxys calcitrans TaxID=35570 RepID=A0A1I8NXF1_STOCA|nr:sterol O-acyltransferase 1 [Stomoxys calcitrans]